MDGVNAKVVDPHAIQNALEKNKTLEKLELNVSKFTDDKANYLSPPFNLWIHSYLFNYTQYFTIHAPLLVAIADALPNCNLQKLIFTVRDDNIVPN